jgi:drug/metabolite transporter (DMT)-like permease
VNRPTLTILAGAILIASSAVLIRLSEASPTASALFRCLFALPPLALFVFLTGGPKMPCRERWIARAAGVVLAATLVLTAYTIEAVGAGLATVLDNLQVVVVGLIAWKFLRERPGIGLFIAIPVMIVGATLVAGVIGSSAYGAQPVLGVFLGLATSALYAVFLLVLRKVGTSPARSLFEVTLGGAAGSAVLAAALPGFHLGPRPVVSLGWLAILALVSQVIGWLLITGAMPKVPAALTSALLLLQPAGAVVLAALIFHENPSGWQLAGVVLILGGVVISMFSAAEARQDDAQLVTRPVGAPHRDRERVVHRSGRRDAFQSGPLELVLAKGVNVGGHGGEPAGLPDGGGQQFGGLDQDVDQADRDGVRG